eukprot:2046079-Rhodomonas_salina.1
MTINGNAAQFLKACQLEQLSYDVPFPSAEELQVCKVRLDEEKEKLDMVREHVGAAQHLLIEMQSDPKNVPMEWTTAQSEETVGRWNVALHSNWMRFGLYEPEETLSDIDAATMLLGYAVDSKKLDAEKQKTL